MDPRTKAVYDLQRDIVSDLLGKLPDRDIEVAPCGDIGDAVIACSKALARTAFEWDGEHDTAFEDTIVDAVALYALAVSTVRWSDCAIAKDEPQAPGQLLTRMMSETMKAEIKAKTLSNEFRLAPYRVPALVGYSPYCHDGRIDYMAWIDGAEDRDFIENVAAIFLK